MMILKLLMNILVAEMLSIRVLMNTIQIKKRNVLIVFDDMIVDMFSHKTLNQQSLNYLSKVGNEAFPLFLMHSLILLYKKYQTKFYTPCFMKTQKKTRVSTNPFINLFKKMYYQSHVTFQVMILLFHQIIFQVLEII